MATNVKNLKSEIDSRLSGGGLTSLECCRLQNSQTILNDCIVYSVANTASLPSANLNEGRVVYVQDINEYRYSIGDNWINDFGSQVAARSFRIWGWGVNTCGVLGNGKSDSTCSPVQEVCLSGNWNTVSISGDPSSFGIKSDGSLWVWGVNSGFQLGVGVSTSFCSPVQEICSETNWSQVSGGGRCFTIALKKSGEIWSWGTSSSGSLGDGTNTTKCSPVREICSATNWCCISAGRGNGSAIKTDGSIWGWGLNNLTQIGDGTNTARCSPVREICSATNWCTLSAGFYKTAAIKTDGSLWLWGQNACGDLANGSTINSCSPVREICSATDWYYISVPIGNNSCTIGAIKTDGSLWTWGSGTSGKLGDGTTISKCSPIREFCSATDWCVFSAGNVMAAIKTDGSLWGWGTPRLDGTTATKCSPVREICSDTTWSFVSSGSANAIALGIKAVLKGFLE